MLRQSFPTTSFVFWPENSRSNLPCSAIRSLCHKAFEALKETIFESINDIPIIIEYNKKQEEQFKEELLKKGITADSVYK